MKQASEFTIRAVGIVLFLFAGSGLGLDTVHAQGSQRLWLHLKTPAGVPLAMNPAELGITERALWRRSKVLPADQLIDVYDTPISQAVLDQIRATGARVRTVSRWLNAVSVDVAPSEARLLESLPAVDRISPVAVYRRRIEEATAIPPGTPLAKRSGISGLDYGSSFIQLNLIKVVSLHDARITGEGILVGMVDDGYNNHRVHEATARNRVLAEYDFIQGDTVTSYQAGDASGQGNHGMYTYSALSGFREGSLIGPAYGSSFLLAKTEVIGSETQIEEDLYVQGLEWLEQQGADLVSSSLGYIDWYTYTDLDGNTAVTTKAALIALRKGVLLVTAMGNEGWYQFAGGPTGTMIAPADADSVISVGAVTSSSLLASFSSTGPTADGRTKPEVVAQGVSVVSASPSSTTDYVAVNGTSLSTPLVAGVAALVLSAHPYLTPAEVRDALMATAVPVNDGTAKTTFYPNNFYGHGLVDAREAVVYHGPAFSNTPMVVDRGSSLDIVTFVLSKTALDPDSVFVYYKGGAAAGFQRIRMSPTAVADQFLGTIPKSAETGYPRGYLSVFSTGTGSRTHPFNAPDSLFDFSSQNTSTGRDPVPSSFALHPNYPNPFNAGTTIVFDAPVAGPVELSIYTLLGQRLVTLLKGDAVQGTNVLTWDGRDASGAQVPSGVYVYTLSTPQGTQSKRMMVLK